MTIVEVPLDVRKWKWLYFDHGAKIIDPSRCPLGIMAYNHWSLIRAEIPVGEPNTECGCLPEPDPFLAQAEEFERFEIFRAAMLKVLGQ